MTNSLDDLCTLLVSPASFSIYIVLLTSMRLEIGIWTLLFYLKLYILSCVMMRERSCAQLYLLNLTTLQLIITTSRLAKRLRGLAHH